MGPTMAWTWAASTRRRTRSRANLGIAGGVYGKSFDGPVEDAAGFVQLRDGEVEGLLSGLGGLGGVGEVQDQADFQMILCGVRV